MTGATLQALAAVGRSRGAAAQRAVAWLRANQNDDGGFGQFRGRSSNAQSTSYAVQGLVAAKAGGAAVSRALAYLRGLQRRNGSVAYSSSSVQTPVWVTAQALMALRKTPLPVATVPRARGSRAAGGDASGAPATQAPSTPAPRAGPVGAVRREARRSRRRRKRRPPNPNPIPLPRRRSRDARPRAPWAAGSRELPTMPPLHGAPAAPPRPTATPAAGCPPASWPPPSPPRSDSSSCFGAASCRDACGARATL